ncbi:MAG: carboxypeptidase-like regulatory domain-containing protein [Chlorobi bacterium]|nr:carboxypeptidase-like regulatory domain-containing protein [Chlorobiota bacterium]
MIKYNLVFFLVILFSFQIEAQNDSVIQLSGFITVDSAKAVPYAHIINITKNQGTLSNFQGFFSFALEKSDTVLFSSLGFKHKLLILPDSIKTTEYFLNIHMEVDTFLINEIEVFPWPTYAQFKQAFLELDIPDDDYERALKNIEIINIQKYAESSYADAGLSYKTYMNQQYNQLYSRGQYPINNLLNPLAWAKFIKAIRNGDFKREKDKDK